MRLFLSICPAQLVFLLLAACMTTAARAQPQPETASARYRCALQLYNQKSYLSAARSFDQLRAAYPDQEQSTEALYYQASARLRSGQAAAAQPLLRSFLAEHAHHALAPQAALALARTLRQSGQAEEGTAYLERYLPRLAPKKQGEVLLALGRSALRRDDVPAGLAYLRRAASHEAVAPEALRLSAQTQLQRGAYAEAAALFEQLTRITGGTAHTAFRRAQAYYHIGQFAKTVDALDEASSLNSSQKVRALLMRAESSRKLGRTSDALAAYQKLLRIKSNNPYVRRALFGRAYLLQQQHQFAEAADAFRRVRKIGTGDSLARRALFWEAQNRARMDQSSTAIDLYGELLGTWPDARLARRATFELGVLLYRADRRQEAHRTFSRYLNRYPTGPMRGEVLRLRSQIDADRGALSQALQNFENVEDENALPDSTQRLLHLQRAWLLFQQGRFEKAASAFVGVEARYSGTEVGAEALFWAAESYFRQEQYARATDFYQRYLHGHPHGERTDAARYSLAWTLFNRKRYEAASNTFSRFLRAYEQADESVPYRTDAQLRLGDSYYAQRSYRDAVEAYSRVSGQGRDYALYQLGKTHYRLGEYDKALAFLNTLSEDYPGSRWHAEAQYTEGYIQLQQQHFEKAVATYRHLLDTNPSPSLAARTQYGIGDALFNAGQLEKAIMAYEKVLRRYPDSPQLREAADGIQYAVIALGEKGRSKKIIEKFSEDAPRLADELRFSRGEVLYQSGQPEASLKAFQQFVRSSQQEALLPEAYFYLGQLYANQKQYPEAESYLSRLIDDYPKSDRRVEASRRLAEIYQVQDKDQQALATFQRLERLRPDDPAVQAEARYGQSRALVALDREGEAVTLLETSADQLPETPGTAPVRLGLARLYEERGNERDAQSLYRRIAESSQTKTGAEALYRLGALQQERGQSRDALNTLSRMTSLFPGAGEWRARGLLVQARAARSLGRTGEATRFYEQVTKQYSGTPWAEKARNEKETL